MMKWVAFTDDCRARFLDLILRLNRGLFIQLSAFEKSIFYHYWHKVLNEHTCWLLEKDGKDMAFVSRPDWQAKHWMRWPENLLLIDKNLHQLPSLPNKMKGEVSFRAGATLLSEQNMQAVTIDQIAYTISLRDFVPLNSDINTVKDLHLCSHHAPEIQALLSETEGDAKPYYRNELKRMIANNAREQYGFGYYTVLKKTNLPIAVVFYEAFEMPLTGTPCMLVSDIFVKKQYRNQGIATQLQSFAYADMKGRGVNWVVGNIDSENQGSVSQALKLGRTPWAFQVSIVM